MKTLTCIVTAEEFEQITAGNIREYSIEITPSTASQYYRMHCRGKEYLPNDPVVETLSDEENVDLVPIKYDSIRFHAGTPSSPGVEMRVDSTEMTMPVDENGDFYIYEENDSPYLLTLVTYFVSPL